MVIVMDMSTGNTEKLSAEEAAVREFGAFVDEVLNAGWMPQPETRLEMHVLPAVASTVTVEPEEFLRNLYRNQE